MPRVAQFHKVSLKEFQSNFESDVTAIYEDLKCPQRATAQSAGYDFFTPYACEIQPQETITIHTGIRCEMDPDWVLEIYPRSGLGFKYGLRLSNTVGIIDADYAFSDNEGHIHIRLFNPSSKTISLPAQTAFAQGVFLPYGLTHDDACTTVRNGGLGSTDKEKK